MKTFLYLAERVAKNHRDLLGIYTSADAAKARCEAMTVPGRTGGFYGGAEDDGYHAFAVVGVPLGEDYDNANGEAAERLEVARWAAGPVGETVGRGKSAAYRWYWPE